MDEKLHQSEEALIERKVEEALFRLEEFLTFIKAECAEVERDNSILEENLKKNHKQLKDYQLLFNSVTASSNDDIRLPAN